MVARYGIELPLLTSPAPGEEKKLKEGLPPVGVAPVALMRQTEQLRRWDRRHSSSLRVANMPRLPRAIAPGQSVLNSSLVPPQHLRAERVRRPALPFGYVVLVREPSHITRRPFFQSPLRREIVV